MNCFAFPTAVKGAAFQSLLVAASAFSFEGGKVGGVVLKPAPDTCRLLLHIASMLQTERSEGETLSELQSHSIVKPFKCQILF